MAYPPTTWVEKQTKLGPTNLNKLEQGLKTAADVADAAQQAVGSAASLALVIALGS